MRKPSPRQQDVLDSIRKLYPALGRFPTPEEIAADARFSSSANVYAHLKALIDKGHLEKKGRTYQMVQKGICPWCEVPFSKIHIRASGIRQFRFVLEKRGALTLGPVQVTVLETDLDDPNSLINLMLIDGWQSIRDPKLL